jgi:hypothetical protein
MPDVALVQDPVEVATGIWVVAILFIWTTGEIEWDLEDGHLSGFARALKFRRFEAVGPFVHDIQSMRHYVITPSSAKVG